MTRAPLWLYIAPMKREWLIAAGVLSSLVVGYLFLPVWRAGQRFESGSAMQRCEAAQDLAYEWASLGFSGKSADWSKQVPLLCFRANRLMNEGKN